MKDQRYLRKIRLLNKRVEALATAFNKAASGVVELNGVIDRQRVLITELNDVIGVQKALIAGLEESLAQ